MSGLASALLLCGSFWLSFVYHIHRGVLQRRQKSEQGKHVKPEVCRTHSGVIQAKDAQRCLYSYKHVQSKIVGFAPRFGFVHDHTSAAVEILGETHSIASTAS
jgi:hypothetical protein